MYLYEHSGANLSLILFNYVRITTSYVINVNLNWT